MYKNPPLKYYLTYVQCKNVYNSIYPLKLYVNVIHIQIISQVKCKKCMNMYKMLLSSR